MKDNNIIEHCNLDGDFEIGNNNIITGIKSFKNLYLEDNLCFYELAVSNDSDEYRRK